MKKLLSLLSVLTISGTAVPTTIAASPYQKQLETNTIVKDGDINYQQTDNKSASSYLENNNNFSWLNTISALWEIGIKKAEEARDYLVKIFENIKNGLENLSFDDLLNLFKLNRTITCHTVYGKKFNEIADSNSPYVNFHYPKTIYKTKYYNWECYKTEDYFVYDFRLGKDPIILKLGSIEFNDLSTNGTKVTWGNSEYVSSTNVNDAFSGIKINDISKNINIKNLEDARQVTKVKIQHLKEPPWKTAYVEGIQNLGIAWYQDDDKNFHLQLIGYQSGEVWGSVWPGYLYLDIGSGFKIRIE